MFGHIRRHQKGLMGIFGTVVIISMVQFLDHTTGRRGRGRSIFSRGSSEYGSINGRSISAEEYAQMKREARLRFFVNSGGHWPEEDDRSEEHTSELQSHSFISYAVFCLKKT